MVQCIEIGDHPGRDLVDRGHEMRPGEATTSDHSNEAQRDTPATALSAAGLRVEYSR
jgi:hypothetical protein